MGKDEKWLAGLSGKKREIALLLLRGQDDSQIVEQQVTTIHYVQKTKSELRRHGFEISDARKSRRSDKVPPPTIRASDEGDYSSDGVTAEVAVKVYADFRAGVSNEEIAAKHNLRGRQVLALRQEWHSMNGCDAFAKMEQEFANEGADLYNLLRYMKEQKKTPKTLVESISRISDLDEQEKRLIDSVTKLTLEEQSKKQSVMQVSGELNNLRNELGSIQQEIDEKLSENTDTQGYIAEQRIALDKLNSAVATTKKKLGEERAKTDSYVRSVVDSYVEELLNNRTELWARPLSTLVLTVKNNFMLQYEFMEMLRKPIVNADDVKNFTSKWLNLLGPYYHSLKDDVADRAYWHIRGQVR